ncbi:MAG: hypothetical protein QNJ18_04495 [Xenococcaceae cyanobacterium MO_167.B52]|nr:hypothetical protein [Xenococcaceae cyanobacterium MO_167.B52]
MTITVNLQIPFESLVQAIQSLSLEDQHKLLEILEDRIFEAEEEWENSPEIIAEVEEARKDYEAGDYVTLDEFISN